MTTNKLTTDEAIRQEIDNILDAIMGGGLSPDDSFLTRYASESVRAQLQRIDDVRERRFILDSHVDAADCYEASGYVSLPENGFLVPVGEIEIAKPDDMEWDEFLADPSDWYIDGELAYCTLDGVIIPVDVEGLRKELDEDEFERFHDVRPNSKGYHPKYSHLAYVELESHFGSYIVTSPARPGYSLLMSADDAEHMLPGSTEHGYGYVVDDYLDMMVTDAE